MKNFFKKLSFVLALAMVLTSIAPATASAATKNYIAKKDSKQASTVYVFIGGAECDLDYSDASVKGTWKSADESIAKVDKNGVITPVANGKVKISFVSKDGKTLAKQTVRVCTRAAKLNVYDYAEYAAGTKNVLNGGEYKMTVGEKRDLQITMPISKAKKAAGGVSSSYASYCTAISDEAVVAVTKVNDRKYTLEAKAAGEATVTIAANQTSEANVLKGTKYVKAEFTVKVAGKLAASQTGAAKITVTGTDLSDKVADYVVKRGNIELSIASVSVNEAKTEAVLTSASSNIPAGDYVLTVSETSAEFKAEKAVVDQVIIEPDVAVMDASDAKKAYAYYTVLNQFGEDVTYGPLGATVQANGSNNATIVNRGTVTFTNGSNPFTMNLSQVSVSLVCKDNGKNATKVLTVAEKSKLASVEFRGVYSYVNGKYVEGSLALAEGSTTGALNTSYLLFNGKDQYGRLYNTADDKLTVNLLSTTGLTCVSNASIDVDGDGVAESLAFKLTVNASIGKLGAGDVQVMTVCLNNGSQTSNTITVANAVKIDTLTIYEKDAVYGGQKNELAYEAIDTNGNVVTSYAQLKSLNAKFTGGNPQFVRRPDGTAKLEYTAQTNTQTVNIPAVVTFLSDTAKFSTCNLSILPNRVPVAIIGIKNVTLGVVSGTSLNVKRTDLKIQDQYGNIIEENAGATSAILDTVTISAVTVGANNAGVTTGNAVGTNGTLVSIVTSTIASTAATTIQVAIDGVEGSEFKFNVYNVALDDLTNFSVGDFAYVQKDGTVLDIENVANDTYSAMGHVYGQYNGIKVKLHPSNYFIFNYTTTPSAVSVPAINVLEGKVEKEGSFTVRINNKLASEVTKTYKYSNMDSTYTFSDYFFQTYTGKVDVSTGTAVNVATAIAGVASITDQYGDSYAGAKYYTVTGLPVTATITANGTPAPKINFAAAGEYTLTVKYTLTNGQTFTTDIVFNAQ